LQVAISFIIELINLEKTNEYHIFLSAAADVQLDKSLFPSNFQFYLIENSPSSLGYRYKVVKNLNDLESKINPDIVFTVFGPTFWRSKSKHIMGFALPWLINPDSKAFDELSLFKRFRKKLENRYKAYYVKRDADFYITETEDTKSKLAKYLEINLDKIFVVGNTYNSYFDSVDVLISDKLPLKKENEFRLVTISHNYPHKNLKIIREVCKELHYSDLNYKFILTIDKKSFKKLFYDLKDSVINIGPITSKECPSVYSECDALFLPTLLECFTASYPEALKMNKPILTSNLSFAHDICGDAAIYFNPFDSKDIADNIIILSNNEDLKNSLIDKGHERLNQFETAKSRAEKYLKIIESFTND
jgi:glycosyltransferase involved in cell wall biosynthesis